MGQISEVEEKPFTSSLNVYTEACCGKRVGAGPSNASNTLFHGYFIERRRNRCSPHRCFLHNITSQCWLCLPADVCPGGCIQGTGRLFPLYWTAGGGEGALPLKEMEGGEGGKGGGKMGKGDPWTRL